MVQRILECTGRVLVQHGYDGTSTLKIAKVAGISVGSIYQYFPNKHSIVAALIGEVSRRSRKDLRKKVSASLDQPVEGLLRAAVQETARIFQKQADLLAVLVNETPRFGDVENLLADHVGLRDLAEEYLLLRGIRISSEALDRMIYLSATGANALVLNIVLHRPPHLDRDALIEEVVQLLLRYLRGGGGGAP